MTIHASFWTILATCITLLFGGGVLYHKIDVLQNDMIEIKRDVKELNYKFIRFEAKLDEHEKRVTKLESK